MYNKLILISIISIISNNFIVSGATDYSSAQPTTEIVLHEKASGGTLILGQVSRDAPFVSIDTIPGESASSVALRLARKIEENNPFWIVPVNYPTVISTEGGTIRDLLGGQLDYFIAGDEMGLGIPKAPSALTFTYNSREDKITINWINTDVYDVLYLIIRYGGSLVQYGEKLAGSTTSMEIDKRIFSHSDKPMPMDYLDNLDLFVLGIKNGTPSNIATIHVSDKGMIQQELANIPFSGGVMPNWSPWFSADKGIQSEKHFKQKIKDQKRNSVGKRKNRLLRTLSEKSFNQNIIAPPSGGTLGIYRMFVGLNSRHKYKLTARLNTHEIQEKENGWSYTLHLAHNGLDGIALNDMQLAGSKALPSGSKGKSAGRISKFSSDNVTKGEYLGCSGEIILPEGVDTITVWLRLKSHKEIKVGLDWIMLEDLGIENLPK